MVTTQKNELKSQVDGIQTEQDNMEDLEASLARLHEVQDDLKGMLRTLARQVESIQGGAHSGLPQSENSASPVMDVGYLKSKVTRLMEGMEHCIRSLDREAHPIYIDMILPNQFRRLTSVMDLAIAFPHRKVLQLWTERGLPSAWGESWRCWISIETSNHQFSC